MNLSDRASISTIFATFDKIDTTPPPKVLAAHERLTTMVDAYANRPFADHDGLAVAVIAAFDRGATDPAADPDVQRIFAQRQLPERDEFIRDALGLELKETLRTELDDVLDVWRGPFDAAAQTLQAAHDVLGSVDLANTTAIIARGPECAAAWGDAQAALATIEAIKLGWNMLRAFLTRQLLGKTFRLATIATVDPGTWIDKGLTDEPGDPWAALGLGLTLELPSFDDYDRFISSVHLAGEQRHAAAQAAAVRRPPIAWPAPTPDAA